MQGKTTPGTNGGVPTSPTSPTITNVVTKPGETARGYHFAELVSAQLCGYLYNDSNGNGIKDPGEAGFAGLTVNLTGTNDLGPIATLTTLTDARGQYCFMNLRPGVFNVFIPTPPPGFLDGLKSHGSALIVGSAGSLTIPNIVIAPGQQQALDNNFGTLTAPSVVGLQRLGVHTQPTRLVVTFSQAMDPASAQNPGNYSLTDSNGQVIVIRSAVHNPTTRSVTLQPSTTLDVHRAYSLSVSDALANASGVTLGSSGGSFVGKVDSTILTGLTFGHSSSVPRGPSGAHRRGTHAKTVAHAFRKHG